MKGVRVAFAVVLLAGPGQAATCPAAPDPVFTLAYGSRYVASDQPGTTLDPGANDAVDEELGPIDDFLRDLTRDANAVLAEGADRGAIADCVIGRMAVWAGDDALGDLVSTTSKLTMGSRIAAFALAAGQVAPFVTRAEDLTLVKGWLARRQSTQMVFWEEDASAGAAQGNLRAWAALAGNAVGALIGDKVMVGWSAWSVRYIVCKAAADGSLPQEMKRGRFALHYQLHALAPLVVTAARLARQGMPVDRDCDAALGRAVAFAVGDLDDGAATRAITGEVQTFFDGSDAIEGFNLAWIEAWLTLTDDPDLDALAEPFRPLSHSKLGGDQTATWRARP